MENKMLFLNWVKAFSNLQKRGDQNGFSLEQTIPS